MNTYKEHGFTLIELMIVVAIIGILAATALPFFQDYSTRAKMSEVLAFAASAKTAVSECLISEIDTTKCNSNTLAGLAPKTDINSQYVTSVEVGSIGAATNSPATITIIVQNSNSTALDGTAVTLTSSAPGGSNIQWTCSPANTGLNKFFPSTCRST